MKRTHSWAWQRDNEGEETAEGGARERQQQGDNDGYGNGNGKFSKERYKPWNCVVCKRANSSENDACTVCFTKKDYKPKAKARGQRNSVSEGKRSTKETDASEFARAAAASGAGARPQTVAGTPTRGRRGKNNSNNVSPVKFEAEAAKEKPWWEIEEEQNKSKSTGNDQPSPHRGPSIRVSGTAAGPPATSPKHYKRAQNNDFGREESPTRAEEVDTDDEYVEEDTWEYDEEVRTSIATFEDLPGHIQGKKACTLLTSPPPPRATLTSRSTQHSRRLQLLRRSTLREVTRTRPKRRSLCPIF